MSLRPKPALRPDTTFSGVDQVRSPTKTTHQMLAHKPVDIRGHLAIDLQVPLICNIYERRIQTPLLLQLEPPKEQ